jgi:molecular chaperone HscC
MIIGIDLGTTNSRVGVWRDGQPELVVNALGSTLTPSAVYVDAAGRILVGRAARDRLVADPGASIAAFKRFMGTDREFQLGPHRFRAEELSALVLAQLKDDAEAYLGQQVTEAVITVPAYFNDAQRKATMAAASLAGLSVERLINEPTAAALAYGLSKRRGTRRILVLNLGGGTFDVSVLEAKGGAMAVRAASGDNFLGGEDFVDAIIDRFIQALSRKIKLPPRSTPSPVHGPLRRAAEIAKRMLGEQDRHEIRLIADGKLLSWTLTRDELDRLAAPLIGRVRGMIERTLSDAGLASAEVTDLVLAGGATRMPVFRNLLQEMFGVDPVPGHNPDEIVALGAVVQAGLAMGDMALKDVAMADVAPFSMGIQTVRTEGGRIVDTGVFLPIIGRNAAIPASGSTRVTTSRDDQLWLRLAVFQGEAEHVRDNISLGQVMVPVPRGAAGSQKIEIRFSYDVNGMLAIESGVAGSDAMDVVDRLGHPGVLTAPEIADRHTGLADLATYPREEAENQAVIARAARLYEERLGDDRKALAQVIEKFSSLLARSDRQEIVGFREKLVRWLDNIDRSYSV